MFDYLKGYFTDSSNSYEKASTEEASTEEASTEEAKNFEEDLSQLKQNAKTTATNATELLMDLKTGVEIYSYGAVSILTGCVVLSVLSYGLPAAYYGMKAFQFALTTGVLNYPSVTLSLTVLATSCMNSGPSKAVDMIKSACNLPVDAKNITADVVSYGYHKLAGATDELMNIISDFSDIPSSDSYNLSSSGLDFLSNDSESESQMAVIGEDEGVDC